MTRLVAHFSIVATGFVFAMCPRWCHYQTVRMQVVLSRLAVITRFSRCDFSLFCTLPASEGRPTANSTVFYVNLLSQLCTSLSQYTVNHKKWQYITLENIDQFFKFLHCCKQEEIFYTCMNFI